MNEKNKSKVLITGASRGLGLAMVKQLASQYTLILHASKEGSFTEARKVLGEDAQNHHFLCADFSSPEGLAEFCKRLRKEHGDTLYGVINNAGFSFDKSLLFQPEKEIDAMLQVNLKAPIMITKTAMKIYHKRKKGVIINIGSCVGEMGNAFQSIYATTKAGLVAFTKSISKEIAALHDEHQIRIVTVSPGFIETEMTDAIPEAEKEKYLARIPSRRFGKAEEIADTITFLLSDKASYINGVEIKTNGGIV